MRSMRVLAVVVLAVVLALSSAQNAFSSQEIFYDNGNFLGAWDREYVGVRFSIPTGVSSAHLLAVSFYWIEEASVQGSGMVMAIRALGDPFPVTVHITPSPPASGPELTTAIDVPAPIVNQWNIVDLSDRNIIVSGDFYVAIQQPVFLTVAYDDSPNSGRSVGGDSLAGVTDNNCCEVGGSHNLMIRAEIDPIVPITPVGGFMEPTNKLAVFAPYLALFGVIGAVAVVFRKRPDN